jgi:hypothetical protein
MYANLYYNYQEGEKWFLNVALNMSHNYENSTYKSLLYPVNDPSNSVDMWDNNKNTTNRPWLDIYFQRNLGKRRTFIFNVVTTYIHNNVERNYTEDKKRHTFDRHHFACQGDNIRSSAKPSTRRAPQKTAR